MSLSNDLSEDAAHYLRLAKEFSEKAETAEYARLKERLRAVATEWARLADVTAKGAEQAESDSS